MKEEQQQAIYLVLAEVLFILLPFSNRHGVLLQREVT